MRDAEAVGADTLVIDCPACYERLHLAQGGMVTNLKIVPPITADLESYCAGQRLCAEHCAGCHGEFGNGIGRVGHLLRPEPRDFTNRAWLGRRSDEYLYQVIADGLADTAMPGYRDLLSPAERALLLRYPRYFADPAAKQTLEQGLTPP